MSDEPRFRQGEVVAWRNCPRDASGRHSPSFAIGMRVIRDEPHDLVLFRGHGYPMRRRNSERQAVDGFRHQPVIRLLDGWHVAPEWTGDNVIVVMDPEARHATSLFLDRDSSRLQFWYIDIIGPVTRRGTRLDFLEHGLDAVVEPDMSAWRLKDDDELQWNVEHGIYTPAEADELRAEAQRAVNELMRERDRFEPWISWPLDPTWTAPALPAGWDSV